MSSSLDRKNAVSIGDALKFFLVENGMVAGHNSYRICRAWEEVSGAAAHTVKQYFHDGTLTVTVNSSMARMHLEFEKDALLRSINACLAADELFIKDGLEQPFVKELKLR